MLEKKADALLSEYVRRQNANAQGLIHCYTCCGIGLWKDHDAGHYHKRHIRQLRYDLRNVKPQCTRCNRYLDGNQSSFALNLTRQYGPYILEELEVIRNQPPMSSMQLRDLYETTIEKYTKLLKELNDEQ